MNAYEVVVVGGGPAGLQAALLLGLGGTRAVVFDSGTARHLVAAQSHSFLGADGMPPVELRRRGREQLAPYETIEFRDAVVEEIERDPEGGFRVHIAGEGATTARFVLLATGMRDVLPDVTGFRDYWGRSILHCPYCHGWEYRGRQLGALVTDEGMLGLALKSTWWSPDVILFLSPDLSLTPEMSEQLSALDAVVERRRVRRFLGDVESGRLEAVELEDGTVVPRTAVYYSAHQRQNGLVEKLGSSLDLRFDREGFVEVDDDQQTNVPGLYAAGDLTTSYQQIVEAARQGHRAATCIERALKAGGRPAGRAHPLTSYSPDSKSLV